jgi:hypothetical protein
LNIAQKSIAISKILPVIELQSSQKASSREFPTARHFQRNPQNLETAMLDIRLLLKLYVPESFTCYQ